jgi:predicted MFS family arabinose efflux permease
LIVALIAASIIFFTVLVIVERRAVEPMLPISLFRIRNFNIAVAVSFVVGIAMYGAITFLPLFLQVVGGASATNSGVLILPLMLGLVIASVVAGQVTSRTGRYKYLPVSGTFLIATALLLMGSMNAGTSRATTMSFMVLLGIGLGFTLQTLVLAIQNSVSHKDLGSATSSPNFFRALGGSIGVALLGAIFNAQLTSHLRHLSITVNGGSSFDIAAVNALSASNRAQFNDAFADSLTGIFYVALPLAVIAWALTCFLKEIPLRTSIHGATTSTKDELTVIGV